jgi:NADP-dependent aldehyde dehydrogenase
VAARGAEIARGFVASYTLGAGQFCTKPGLLFLPAGHNLDEVLVAESGSAALPPLLGERIRTGFLSTAHELAAVPGVRALLPPATDSTVESAGYGVSPVLLAVSADGFAKHPLVEECFGPAAVVVEYESEADLEAALETLPGALTASVHAEPDTESELAGRLLDRFKTGAGRVIWNGWPTGVAVTGAQHHGGPWPATNTQHTSVGTTAIRRFLRPVTYQSLPDALLPEPLRDANPLGLPRRVDGRPTSGPVTPPPGG